MVGVCVVSHSAFAAAYTLQSPNGRIEVDISVKGQLTRRPKIAGEQKRVIDETVRPVVPEKRAVVHNECTELSLTLKGGHGVRFRAYNDGVAYRFFTNFDTPVRVTAEEATFAFPKDFKIYHTLTESYHSSQETPYIHERISEFEPGSLAYAPLLVEAGGVKVAVTESGLTDYPGMWITRHEREDHTLIGIFPPYPLEEETINDRKRVVTETADYLAETAGTRSYPWRVLVIVERAGQLIESDMVYRLAPPLALEDTTWIKPGKVAWDWWNALNIYNVDFESGINTSTYKHYIDFAARHGIEHIILDEGWSNTRDLLDIDPNVDLGEIMRYAKDKDVGVILWCIWLTLDRQLEEALATFEQWGVKGVKVDFMDRDDQKIVRFYERVARATAQHKLLLDFHGAYKPTGLRRAYPNLITREGVIGLEYCKWSKSSDPEYTVTIPFIRMLAGPMDYTPGAMNNARKQNFRPLFDRPMSQGTRAHQLAMYVVFESPLQMLSDTPTAYERNPECLDFISHVPTTWDETVVLDAEVAEYVVAARRKGSEWYIGAMTDWSDRQLRVDMSFLGQGKYEALIIADGTNAERIAIDHTHKTLDVDAQTELGIKLAPGGGWAARIIPRD